jgi:hypothetical protein
MTLLAPLATLLAIATMGIACVVLLGEKTPPAAVNPARMGSAELVADNEARVRTPPR